jgi:hypothetical protein
VGPAGLEPATYGLKVRSSTIELEALAVTTGPGFADLRHTRSEASQKRCEAPVRKQSALACGASWRLRERLPDLAARPGGGVGRRSRLTQLPNWSPVRLTRR